MDIQPCLRTSEGWNPPQIPGGLTRQGILGRYPKGILERDLNHSSRIIVNSCFRMKLLTNHEEFSRRTHSRRRIPSPRDSIYDAVVKLSLDGSPFHWDYA
jgi:hypothetical protein